jgi:hypothetical protein
MPGLAFMDLPRTKNSGGSKTTDSNQESMIRTRFLAKTAIS